MDLSLILYMPIWNEVEKEEKETCQILWTIWCGEVILTGMHLHSMK